jgi:hypothetical protein
LQIKKLASQKSLILNEMQLMRVSLEMCNSRIGELHLANAALKVSVCENYTLRGVWAHVHH